MQAIVQPRQEVDGSRIPELKSIVSEALSARQGAGRHPGRSRRQPAEGSDYHRAARRSRNRRIPARSRHGHHGVLRQAQGFGEHRRPVARARWPKPSRKPATSRATPPRTNAPGLADPEELARDIPDLDLDHPWDISPEQAVETARAPAKRPGARSTRASPIPKAPASAATGACACTATRMGSSPAIPSTSHSVSCVLLAQTGDDMQRDYWYGSARDARDLESAESIGRKAGERAVARLGARKIAHAEGARAVRARSRARPHRPFPRRGARQQPVPQELVPARRCGPAGVSVVRRAARAAAHPQGARQQSVRWRRRGDARSRAGAATACCRATCSAATRRASSA